MVMEAIDGWMAPENSELRTREFLDLLFPNDVPPDRRLYVLESRIKKVAGSSRTRRQFRNINGQTEGFYGHKALDRAADAISNHSEMIWRDLYLGIALRSDRDLGHGHYGGKDDCREIKVISADIDIDPGYEGKPKLRPFFDQDQVLDFCSSLGDVAPTFMLSSGTGVHAYWVLIDPIDLNEDLALYEELTKAWLYHLRWWVRSRYEGGSQPAAFLDPTFTAQRAWRIPGTFNYKPKYDRPLPVDFIRPPQDRRFSLSAFWDEMAEHEETRERDERRWAEEDGETYSPSSRSRDRTEAISIQAIENVKGQFSIDLNCPRPQILDELLRSHDVFRGLWDSGKRPGIDDNVRDMKLTYSILNSAPAMLPADIVDILVLARTFRMKYTKEPFEKDEQYYARTLIKAYLAVVPGVTMAVINESGLPKPDLRMIACDKLSTLYNIDIAKVTKIETQHGLQIALYNGGGRAFNAGTFPNARKTVTLEESFHVLGAKSDSRVRGSVGMKNTELQSMTDELLRDAAQWDVAVIDDRAVFKLQIFSYLTQDGDSSQWKSSAQRDKLPGTFYGHISKGMPFVLGVYGYVEPLQTNQWLMRNHNRKGDAVMTQRALLSLGFKSYEVVAEDAKGDELLGEDEVKRARVGYYRIKLAELENNEGDEDGTDED